MPPCSLSGATATNWQTRSHTFSNAHHAEPLVKAVTMEKQAKCPYIAGQIVVYKPSSRGMALDIMSPQNERLVPGTSYRIAEVRDEQYVVPEGYEHPGGGLHWTEFALK